VEITEEFQARLDELDAFIEREIMPLQAEDDNDRFFDHRREYSRTNFEADGVPSDDWMALLREMKRRADKAGWLRYGLPEAAGGSGGSNFEMAIIRERLATRGLGLFNDLQNESSVVGNFPLINMLLDFGTPEQREEFIEPILTGSRRLSFALTEPDHGSDATWLESTAVQDGSDWVIRAKKKWISGMPHASHALVFARTSGEGGSAKGITAFLVPTDAPGFAVDRMLWTFNMPTDHAELSLTDVRVPASSVFGEVGNGLAVAQSFVHQNRIRQAASGVGAAQFCVNRSVEYTSTRETFGQTLASRQAIQFPLAELHTEVALVRSLVHDTATAMDHVDHYTISDRVSMCNYRANRLVCEAADRAIQVHGGNGYSRNEPFEHIYRHHRRYRITEGSDEVQIRKVAAYLFGFAGPNRKAKR
jgi:alkylation response protein AidB-like acyl-CoA dehydrogenase